jgi:hypothetical protein
VRAPAASAFGWLSTELTLPFLPTFLSLQATVATAVLVAMVAIPLMAAMPVCVVVCGPKAAAAFWMAPRD